MVKNVQMWQYVASHLSLARKPVGGGVSPQRHPVVLGWWYWAHHTCSDRNVISSELMLIFISSSYLRISLRYQLRADVIFMGSPCLHGSYRYQLRTDINCRQSRSDYVSRFKLNLPCLGESRCSEVLCHT